MNIQVGDRVTFITGVQIIIIQTEQIEEFMNYGTIAKIERIGMIGWYTVYEKEEKLLTEEEKEFLKQFIKFNDYIINGIKKTKHRFNFYIDNRIVETMEVAEKYFNNLEYGRVYTLSELGLED